MPVDSQDLILARIDERTKIIVEEIGEVKESIDKLNTVVFTGNGKESLVTRTSLLEDDLDRFAEQCAQCKAVILAKPKDSDAPVLAEIAKTRVVEEWKFLTAVAVGVLGLISTLILALKP